MATMTEDRTVRTGAYPEFTWAAFIVGLLLGVLIAISIGYASLILGFSIEGSELAAILGFGVLRGLLNRKSIIENNINQTVASAVNGASSGMMFSVPALFILGYTNFNAYHGACVSPRSPQKSFSLTHARTHAQTHTPDTTLTLASVRK